MPEIPRSQSLTEVQGDLILAALCIGQFRAPCQIEHARLLVLADDSLLQALGALGLMLRPVSEPFTPAPLFAPEALLLDEIARGAARRHVKTHISRHHDEEAEEDPPVRSSNA